MEVYPTQFFRKYNNFNFSDDIYDGALHYLKTGEVPAEVNPRNRWHYRKKWDQFGVGPNDRLFHRSTRLKVLRENEKEPTFRQYFASDLRGLGKGIDKLLKSLRQEYLNYTRTDIQKYTKDEANYQLTRKQHVHVTNKPYLSTKPNNRWFCDLIDMSNYPRGSNGQKRYIFTVIDDFSRYAFARGIREKTPERVREAFQSILQEAGQKPKKLVSDNGGEFLAAFTEYLTTEGIIHKRTRSWTPQSNGIIESFNKTLRNMIKEGFVRHNDLKWNAHLQTYIQNYNETPHSATRLSPSFLYVTADETMGDVGKGLREEITERHKANNRRKMEKNKTKELDIGDLVRASMHVFYAELRHRRKTGDEKYTAVKWTPERYRIARIIKPRLRDQAKQRYQLKDLQGNWYRNALGRRFIFFASELKKVTQRATTALTRARAIKLNLQKQKLIDRNYNSNIPPPNMGQNIALPPLPNAQAPPPAPAPPPPPALPAAPRNRRQVVVPPTLASTRLRRANIQRPARYRDDGP